MLPNSLILARRVGQILLRHGKTLTLAESCTAGACAKAISDIAGCSAWFEASFITYSNRAKIQLLHINPSLISQHGAVSAEVVEAMVRGALRAAEADIALAVSGIAGPSGGSPAKPVGTVYIAVGDQKQQRSARYLFKGDRSSVRDQSVTRGLKNLLDFCVDSLEDDQTKKVVI